MTGLIEQYLEWLRIRGCTQRTIEARHDILHRIDRDLPYGIESATFEELKGWLYRDGWSKSTKRTYYGAIRGLFTWATNPLDPRLDFDPSQMLPRPNAPAGIPKPVTDEQLAHILTHADEPYRTWAHLAAYEGLRCIEISRLCRQHVTQQHTTILYGKGDEPGIVPTHPAVWRIIEPLPAGPVAWTRSGAPANARYISVRSVIYFAEKLHMPGVSMHRLRHWFATATYAASGEDIRAVQELLGHASVAMTQRYIQVGAGRKAAAVAALPVPSSTAAGAS